MRSIQVRQGHSLLLIRPPLALQKYESVFQKVLLLYLLITLKRWYSNIFSKFPNFPRSIFSVPKIWKCIWTDKIIWLDRFGWSASFYIFASCKLYKKQISFIIKIISNQVNNNTNATLAKIYGFFQVHPLQCIARKFYIHMCPHILSHIVSTSELLISDFSFVSRLWCALAFDFSYFSSVLSIFSFALFFSFFPPTAKNSWWWSVGHRFWFQLTPLTFITF